MSGGPITTTPVPAPIKTTPPASPALVPSVGSAPPSADVGGGRSISTPMSTTHLAGSAFGAAANAAAATAAGGSNTSTPPSTARRAKNIFDTAVEMTELLDSGVTDDRGVLSGSQLLKWMDLCACMSAEKFSGHSSVTAAMDDVRFFGRESASGTSSGGGSSGGGHDLLTKGSLVILRSQVNRAFSTSMEVGCKVYSEDLSTGASVHVASAYFTFVSLNHDGSKCQLPPLTSDGDDDQNKRRYIEANERRTLRLQRREIIMKLAAQHKATQTSKAPAAVAVNSAESKSETKSPALGAATPPANAYLNGLLIPSVPLHNIEWDGAGSVSGTAANPTQQHAVVSSSSFPKKSGSLSFTQMTELILPIHTNHMGNMFGGMTMSWMEQCSRIAATRFTRKSMRLASIDDIFFLTGIRVGDRVLLRACVNRSFGQSVEVGCRVERMGLSGTVEHALTGFVTFECSDGTAIPFTLDLTAPVTVTDEHTGVVTTTVVVSEEATKRYHEAMGRRKIRLARKILRSQSASLACAWSKANAPELVYANIRGLMMIANRTAFDKDQWEILGRVEGAQLTLSMKQSKDFVTCVRLEAPLRGTPKQVFEFLVDLNTRQLWDVVFSNATCVEKIDDRNDVIHFCTRPPAPPQDFVLLRSWRSLMTTHHHSEYVISNRSVLHDAMPPVSGFVRAEVLSSGFLLQPLKGHHPTASTATATAAAPAPNSGSNNRSSLVSGMRSLFSSRIKPPASTVPDEAWTQVQYVVQLGTKALALVSGDLVGDQSARHQSIIKSFANLQRICMERFGGSGATGASGAAGGSGASYTLPPVQAPAKK